MSAIRIILRSIECLKSNEQGRDELYLYLNIKDNEANAIELKERFPKNDKGFWHIGTGEKLEVNETLFEGDILRGFVANIRLLEEDKTAGTKLPEMLEELIDDFIGEFKFIVESSGKVTYEDVRHTKLRDKIHKEYIVGLGGSGSEYHFHFEVK